VAAMSSAPIDVNKAQPLDRLFQIEDMGVVLDFVSGAPGLHALLADVHSVLGRYFTGCPIRLELMRFPEDPDDVQIVVSPVIVDVAFDADRAMDRFDEEWWLDHMNRCDSAVCILPRFA
jgi:hypothetical protein